MVDISQRCLDNMNQPSWSNCCREIRSDVMKKHNKWTSGPVRIYVMVQHKEEHLRLTKTRQYSLWRSANCKGREGKFVCVFQVQNKLFLAGRSMNQHLLPQIIRNICNDLSCGLLLVR